MKKKNAVIVIITTIAAVTASTDVIISVIVFYYITTDAIILFISYHYDNPNLFQGSSWDVNIGISLYIFFYLWTLAHLRGHLHSLGIPDAPSRLARPRAPHSALL